MKFLYFLLLILVVYPGIVSAETQKYNFTIQNNTALNFEEGYYIIEITGINTHSPKFVKVNLTTGGGSRTYNVYESEDPYLTEPYDKIDLRVNSITERETTLIVIFPIEWSYPEKYIIQSKEAPVKLPKIVLTKSADRTKMNVGDIVEIKITVQNKGNGTAYDLVLKEELPQSFSRAPGSRFPPVIQDTLDPGEIQELYYALKAVESGTFNIDPTTVSYGSKSNRSNPITIEVAEEKSYLITDISIDKDNVKTDELISVTVKITNAGKTQATSILVDGDVPSGLMAIEGDLTQVYREIDPKGSEEYTVILKAMEPGNYSINLKTISNDDMEGKVSTSGSIIVTKKENGYPGIIISAAIIIIGIVLYTIRRHREYEY